MTNFTAFQFPATGSPTYRTMPDRLAEIKNVKDYGAIGDGSHDDTVNIQDTIDWTAGANRGTIYFPDGSYKVTAPLTFNYAGPLSIAFQGDGLNSSLTGTVNGGFILDRHLGSPSNEAQVVIEKLNIGNGSATSNTGGVRVGSCKSVMIRDCNIGGTVGLTTEDSAGNSSQNILLENLRLFGPNALIMGGSGGVFECDFAGSVVGARMYGNGWSMAGNRAERCDTAYLFGVDSAGTDQGTSGFSVNGGTAEGNKINMDFAGTCTNFFINAMNFLNHFPPNCGVDGNQQPERGIYIRANKASNGVFSSVSPDGDGCTIAQIQIDAATSRANIVFIGCNPIVLNGGGATWVFPSNAYTVRLLNCNEHPIWTYSQLPTGGNVLEGDEFDISDGNSSTWGANVTAGGSSNRVLVRWNGSNWTVVGK